MQRTSTLVIYVYQNTEDEDQKANWNYFLRNGMNAADGNMYHIAAQELVSCSCCLVCRVAAWLLQQLTEWWPCISVWLVCVWWSSGRQYRSVAARHGRGYVLLMVPTLAVCTMHSQVLKL